jgi:hypothetical protein
VDFATQNNLPIGYGDMKNSKKKVSRPSVVHLAGFLRSGAGKHKGKKVYSRKVKHKGKR